jgi:type I restriction enzyme S subunit
MYVTAKNIKENGIDLSDITYVDAEIHRSIYARCNPEEGDVLLTKDGVKTGVATVNRIREEFTLLSSVALLKVHRDLVDSYFLKHYLSSPNGFRTITGQMTGTAIKRIILEKIRLAPIPLPPLAEQRRIVEAIEQQLTRLDAGVASLRRTQAGLRRYKAAVLKAACEGRLVPQDASDEPADALLRRILDERRAKWEAEQIAKMQAQGRTVLDDGWRAKYQEPQGPDMAGLPELPKGWVWATPEQLASAQKYSLAIGLSVVI